jgi:nucleotide-binding universal stress UspA family protein
MDLKVDPLIIDEFLVGYPAKEITKLAKNKNADLIVMSTRAPQSFLKRWLGSVANEVVSNTNVPTLLIPPNTKINNFKKIVLALESPEDLKHILPKIQWVKQMKDSHIEVLHIKNTDIDEDIDFDLVISEHLDWPLKFNAIQAKKPTDILLNLSEADTNDLIIIYHKDRSWLLDFLNKSDSKKIIGHMKVPILVVV